MQILYCIFLMSLFLVVVSFTALAMESADGWQLGPSVREDLANAFIIGLIVGLTDGIIIAVARWLKAQQA